MILFIDLYFLIPPVVTQIFNPIAELVIPIGIPAKGAKSEIEAHTVIVIIQNNANFFMLLINSF